MTIDTHALLRAYATGGSEDAFREVVARYVGLVYSTALRLVDGDTHRAEDVTQKVFADLAEHAGVISTKVLLGGWLHQRAFNVATTLMRGERRRLAREQEAMQMMASDDSSAASLARIAPILDHAITQLKPDDRVAILLRFFELRDLKSIGQVLGINEDTAQKRVSRALDKLRAILARQGIALSAAALGTALTSDTLAAAPATLAGTIAAAALTSTATGPGTTVALSKTLIMSKAISTILGAIMIVGMCGIIVRQHGANESLRAEVARLKVHAESMPQASQPAPTPSVPQAFNEEMQPSGNQAELLRLRGQIGSMTRELLSLRSNQAALAKLSNMLVRPLDLDQFPDSHSLIRASVATNAGTATPAALLQTWLWALRTGDPDGLARTKDWPEGTSEAAKQEAVNQEAKSIQERGSTVPQNEPEDFRLVALWPIGEDFYVATFRQSNFPTFPDSVGRQFFRKTEDGWKVTVYTPPQGAFLKPDGKRLLDFN